MHNLLFPSGFVSGFLVLLYAALLIIGNVAGAGLTVLLMLVIGHTNSRRHRMEMAHHFPAHIPGADDDLGDDDLGNDWPWKDCP